MKIEPHLFLKVLFRVQLLVQFWIPKRKLKVELDYF